MAKKIIIFLLLVICISFNFLLNAKPEFNYVDPKLLSPKNLTPPLEKGSKEWRDEVDYIIKIQANISEATKKIVYKEGRMIPGMMDVDNTLKRAKYPKTFVVMDKAVADCHKIVRSSKQFFHTTRPYLVDNRIKLYTIKPRNDAYPSGHATCTRVWAEILGQLAPSKREVYVSRAIQIGNNRVIAGAHWPHDLKGADELSALFFKSLQNSTAYQNDIAKAKKEWK